MKKIFLFIPVLFLIGIFGCTKDSTTAAATVDCTNVTAKFAADIQPIFKAKCGNSGCHPSKNMENYTSLKVFVDNGKIKQYIADRSSPPSGMTAAGSCTAEESKKVACWLQNGAKND